MLAIAKLCCTELATNVETKNNKKKETINMKKWICTVCGYVHEGEQPPEECPLCGVGPDQFEEVEE